MRRLDEIVAGLLPGLRAMVVEEGTGEAAGEDAASPLAQRLGSKDRARKGDAHPRSSSRRMAKRAAMTNAKRVRIQYLK